jgi:hypothetical protein
VDGDGYGNPSSSVTSCTGAPPAYVTNNTDCCDTDANARPNYVGSGYSVTRNGCGGYDYNCDGQAITNQPILTCSSASGSCVQTKVGVYHSGICGPSVNVLNACAWYNAGGMSYCSANTSAVLGTVESKCR